jgi:hypothetical protein
VVLVVLMVLNWWSGLLLLNVGWWGVVLIWVWWCWLRKVCGVGRMWEVVWRLGWHVGVVGKRKGVL